MRLRKFLFVFVFFLLFFFAAINLNLIPENIMGNANIARLRKSADSEISLLKNRYDLSFKLSKTAPGNTNVYTPGYSPADYETADYFAKIFNIDNFCELDDFYLYIDNNRRLLINKYTSMLEYHETYPQDEENPGTQITAQEASGIATRFFEEHLLFVNYEETKVDFENGLYTVYLIERLGNLKNYGFISHAVIDMYGRVIHAKYYFINYELIQTCKVKSMYDAYLALPLDFDDDFVVDLKKAQIVYIYEDSILQPAFLFEGEIPGDMLFECFVNAAVYR